MALDSELNPLERKKTPPAGERAAGQHSDLAFPTPGKEQRKRGGGAWRLTLIAPCAESAL